MPPDSRRKIARLRAWCTFGNHEPAKWGLTDGFSQPLLPPIVPSRRTIRRETGLEGVHALRVYALRVYAPRIYAPRICVPHACRGLRVGRRARDAGRPRIGTAARRRPRSGSSRAGFDLEHALRPADHARPGQARHGRGRARSAEEFLAGRHRHSRFRRQSGAVPQGRQHPALRLGGRRRQGAHRARIQAAEQGAG